MRKIIPHKLITTLDKDGFAVSSMLQYKIEIDGKTENKFYTMPVTDGINLDNLGDVTRDAKFQVERGEQIEGGQDG